MRARFIAAAALLVLAGTLGFGMARAAATAETVATETFTNVVTYTIPTVTETVRVTVTVREEPPPPPPPTTTAPAPPPPTGGTLIELTDQQWRCTRPIAELATNGLPLRVVLNYTRPFVPANGGGAAWLGNGCDGDADPATVDLILDIRGDGRSYGPGDDAIRLANASPGPRNLVISGHADCGPRVAPAHQDGVQVLGGLNVTFRNFTIGDYDNGRATCQGAGGAFFYSGASTNVDVEGGRYIACNHGLLAGWASPEANVTGASFRTGGSPVCVQPETFAVSRPCDIRAEWGGTTSGLTCQRWTGSGWRDE